MTDAEPENTLAKVARTFAANEYKDYCLYAELERQESDPEFKIILQKLLQQELDHYHFWAQLAGIKKPAVSRINIFFFTWMRKILGLTFIAKYLERGEKDTVEKYTDCLNSMTGEQKIKLQRIIDEEKYHEKEFINQIKEEKIQFIGSIVLGLNDGLIELTGALVGFTFALHNHLLIALTGLITGISASLSMSSSAYMQAKHEQGKNAKKAAIYTGFSYIIVALLLVIPFFIVENNLFALTIMGSTVLLIIVSISYFTSVVFEKSFRKQFMEIFAFSVGIALIAFIIGSLFRMISGIQV